MEPWRTQWRPAPAHLCKEWRSLSKKAKGALERTLADVQEGSLTLFLSNCELGNAGTFLIVEALRRYPVVRNLNLASNGIDDVGAIEVASVIGQLKNLEMLTLACNKIGDAGAVELAKAVERHDCLKMISLDGNVVGDLGASRLVAALAWNARPAITCTLANNTVQAFKESSTTNLAMPAGIVRQLSMRGITFGQMLQVYNDGLKNGTIDADLTTTQDVALDIILPMTSEKRKSYVETAGFENVSPTAHVIHSWSCVFSSTLRNIASHISGKSHPTLNIEDPLWLLNPTYLQKCFFVDLFCVNQNISINNMRTYGLLADNTFASGEPFCQIDKLHLVAERIQRRGGEVLFTIDPDYLVTTRFLCLRELHAALQIGLNVRAVFTNMTPPPHGRDKPKVLHSHAANERDRQIALDEIQASPGGFAEFDLIIEKFIQDQTSQRFERQLALLTNKKGLSKHSSFR